jgi:hypothetical protein
MNGGADAACGDFEIACISGVNFSRFGFPSPASRTRSWDASLPGRLLELPLGVIRYFAKMERSLDIAYDLL